MFGGFVGRVFVGCLAGRQIKLDLRLMLVKRIIGRVAFGNRYHGLDGRHSFAFGIIYLLLAVRTVDEKF